MKFLTNATLALTPLAPIHIGCGEDFEPTSYVIEDGILYGFDPSRAALPDNLARRLGELGDKADRLGIQRFFRDQRSHFQPHADVLIPVAAGLAADYERQVGQVANRESNGNRVFNQLFIERASHTGKQPYIPGSSFKGALRTAMVDRLNGGRLPLPQEKGLKPNTWDSAKIEARLLQGDFSTSPLRLLKPGDFMPVSNVDRQVLYAVNRYKERKIDRETGAEKQPRGLLARKECIAPGQFRVLRSQLTIHNLGTIRSDGKSTPVENLRRADLSKLATDCNRYHLPRLRAEIRQLDQRGMLDPAWKKSIETLLDGELKPLLDSGRAMLVRLGRYGGAESKTLSGDGVAQIKIMEGKGPDGKNRSSFQSATKTFWLAAQNANDQKHLIPFGWALVEIDPQGDLPRLRAWCEQQAQSRPDMGAVHIRFAEAQAAAELRKAELHAGQAAARQAEQDRQAAEAERLRRLANLSAAMREVEAFIEHFANRADQLAGRKERPNGADHQKAGALAKKALESSDWTAEEKAAAAEAIETWLPRVVAVDLKDARKKLALAKLKGNT